MTTLALLQLRIDICKQLYTAPYLGGVHSISLGHFSLLRERPCQPHAVLVNAEILRVYHSPRPITVVFGLETRLRVRMHTTFENGVLRNEQQPGSAVNSFIDQGEFGAMKMLS